MAPITIAVAGTTNAHEALIATSPAIQPLALRDVSGLPKRMRVVMRAASSPENAANKVLITTSTRRPDEAPAKSRDPAEFRASHPTSAIKQPTRTSTEL